MVWNGGAAVDVCDGVAPLQGLARKQIEMTPTCGSGGTEYRKAADPCSQVRSAPPLTITSKHSLGQPSGEIFSVSK